ncbi:TRAP transporter large permease [Natribacillus halophilus]|uniref:TRAP transporter, DctM subunit n=1 Tax=Natribacillus halophilus TaxID=549003 RepID=A0A1G8MVK2_9BACI|nr:TRAP transporter large permease [Natribacillus halophilus]SDI71972.1 TRAP transporter, DctM subunit [Natribacillus halophilus]
MSPEFIGIMGVVALLLLFLFKFPVSIALIIVGVTGFGLIRGFDTAMVQLGSMPFNTVSDYSLSVIPLFILMGMFLSHSGFGQDLYQSVDKWIGHLKGGMAVTTIGTSSVFAAISGSVNATTATVARISIPEMRRYNYSMSLSAACVAAGGTLGPLIPPSVILILYGILTMEDIGSLLIAGIIPGIVMMLIFILVIYLWIAKYPDAAPPTSKSSWSDRFRSLKNVWPFIFLFIVSIGGIYLGIFTPTEAGSVGAFGSFLLAVLTRRLNWSALGKALSDTLRLSAMIFLILIGAELFSQFLSISRIPTELTSFVQQLDWSPIMILAAILLVYFLLGLFLEGIAILVLTLPIVYPLITSLGFDGLWFGVIMVMVVNIGLITPPLGISIYIISGVVKDIPIEKIFKAVMPMVGALIIGVILFTLFPEIIMVLPDLMN